MLIFIGLFYLRFSYKVAHETDVHFLQFKIISKYIPCKGNLCLWGKESSDKCRLYNEIDTIGHCFAQCSYIGCFGRKFLS